MKNLIHENKVTLECECGKKHYLVVNWFKENKLPTKEDLSEELFCDCGNNLDLEGSEVCSECK